MLRVCPGDLPAILKSTEELPVSFPALRHKGIAELGAQVSAAPDKYIWRYTRLLQTAGCIAGKWPVIRGKMAV